MSIYIYKMRYDVRMKLTDILDAGDFWRELGGRRLNYTPEELNRFRLAVYRDGSPSDAMLTHWGQRNHTVTELFKHLYALKNFQAMDVIKDCVPEKYHVHLKTNVVGPRIHHDFSTQNIDTAPAAKPGASFVAAASTAAAVGASGRVPPALDNPPDPPRDYRRVLKDKGISNNLNVNLASELEEKHAYIYRKMAELNAGQAAVATAADHFRSGPYNNAAVAASTKDKVSNIATRPIPINKQLNPLMEPSRMTGHQGSLNNTPPGGVGAAVSVGTRSDAVGQSISRLKQQTPSKIPMPNPDLMLRNVPFPELAEACNNFSHDNLLGKGGFGEVYIGKWNGQQIAVKRIREERRRSQGDTAYQKYVNQAITELRALHNYPAENVLPLMAFSFTETMESGPCLVYLYMPNGSVADRLKCGGGTEPLTWAVRANIALGTARGLCHLHANNIIHGDIKSGNILLDRHFEPKIGDFGLARGGPESDAYSYKTVSSVQGTAAYLPLDYVRSRHLTPAVDTFCYGIFLFELVSGKSPSWMDPQTRDTIRDIMIDASQPEPWIDSSAGDCGSSSWPKCLFFLGRDCTKSRGKNRPLMQSVLRAVEQLHQNPSIRSIRSAYSDDQRNVEGETSFSAYLNMDSSCPDAAGESSSEQGPSVGNNIPDAKKVLIPTILDDTANLSLQEDLSSRTRQYECESDEDNTEDNMSDTSRTKPVIRNQDLIPRILDSRNSLPDSIQFGGGGGDTSSAVVNPTPAASTRIANNLTNHNLRQPSDIPVLPDMLYDERLVAAEVAVNSALDFDPLGDGTGRNVPQ